MQLRGKLRDADDEAVLLCRTDSSDCTQQNECGGSGTAQHAVHAAPSRHGAYHSSVSSVRRLGSYSALNQPRYPASPSRCTMAVRSSAPVPGSCRSEEHTSELQSLMRTSYAVFCLKKKTIIRKEKISYTVFMHATLY